MPRLGKRKTYDNEDGLYEYAVGALSRKMRTVAELKRLLRQRAEHELLVEVVIARLKEQKYLNDHQYAATYSAYRQSNEKFGKRRVITDLKAKGVHNEVIAKVVDEAYSGVNEEKLAREHLARKRLRKQQVKILGQRIWKRENRGEDESIKLITYFQNNFNATIKARLNNFQDLEKMAGPRRNSGRAGSRRRIPALRVNRLEIIGSTKSEGIASDTLLTSYFLLLTSDFLNPETIIDHPHLARVLFKRIPALLQ